FPSDGFVRSREEENGSIDNGSPRIDAAHFDELSATLLVSIIIGGKANRVGRERRILGGTTRSRETASSMIATKRIMPGTDDTIPIPVFLSGLGDSKRGKHGLIWTWTRCLSKELLALFQTCRHRQPPPRQEETVTMNNPAENAILTNPIAISLARAFLRPMTSFLVRPIVIPLLLLSAG